MKLTSKIITILIFSIALCFANPKIKILKVDASSYPLMRVSFLAYDSAGNIYREFPPSKIDIIEGSKVIEAQIECPSNTNGASIIFTIDRSASMAGDLNGANGPKSRKEYVLDILIKLAQKLSSEKFQNEYCLTAFSSGVPFELAKFSPHALIKDFTSDINDIIIEANKINLIGGTNYNSAFLGSKLTTPPVVGLLDIVKQSHKRPVVYFFTDGEHDDQAQPEPGGFRKNEIIKKAIENNSIINFVIIGNSYTDYKLNEVKELASSSGGSVYLNPVNVADIDLLSNELFSKLSTQDFAPPCIASWNAENKSSSKSILRIKNAPFDANAEFSYNVISSIENVEELHTYPNPAKEKLQININSTKKAELIIYDINKKIIETVILTGNENFVELNIKSYTSGAYYYEVLEDNIIKSKGKFIKE
jgi:hypothetical protein